MQRDRAEEEDDFVKMCGIGDVSRGAAGTVDSNMASGCERKSVLTKVRIDAELTAGETRAVSVQRWCSKSRGAGSRGWWR